MTCSEYLWTRLKFMEMNPDMPSQQVTGELEIMLTNNNDDIYSNTTGERMEADEALSVLGRYATKSGKNKLLEAYHNGQKSLFEMLVAGKNLSDDEWEKAEAEKAKQEAAAAGEAQ